MGLYEPKFSGRYNGCYNLAGDRRWINFAHAVSGFRLKVERMAYYYGVPLETYLAGQEWARENLPRLRREAGLEQEEAAETEDVPQPEEPQSAAPSSSAPPSPVVPAKSLLSFTVHRLIGLFWPFGL